MEGVTMMLPMGMMGGGRAGRVNSIDTDAQKMRLLEALDRFDASRPAFSRGDWITPVKDARDVGHGDPHLVVETRVRSELWDPEAINSPSYGCALDTRVLYFHGDTMVAIWVDSAWYVPWTEELARGARQEDAADAPGVDDAPEA